MIMANGRQKGMDIDLGFALIFIPIVLITAYLYFFMTATPKAYAEECRINIATNVETWFSKLGFNALADTQHEGQIVMVRGCVDYISREGIKFAGDDKVTEFRSGTKTIVFDIGSSSENFRLYADDTAKKFIVTRSGDVLTAKLER